MFSLSTEKNDDDLLNNYGIVTILWVIMIIYYTMLIYWTIIMIIYWTIGQHIYYYGSTYLLCQSHPIL